MKMKVSTNSNGEGRIFPLAVMGMKLKRIRIEAHKAIARLDAGPATDTHMTAAFECWRSLDGLMGTGFAQPNPIMISMRLPMISRCFRGLRVGRPFSRAVSSPKRSAINACENSCTVNAMTRVMTRETISGTAKFSIASPVLPNLVHFVDYIMPEKKHIYGG